MKRTSWQIQRAVIFALVVRELQTRFGGRLIGLFWVIAEPIVQISIILLIRVVLRSRFSGVMIDTAVYLTVAMIPFFVFRNVWYRVMEGANANAGLFGYRQVKPFDAFVARAVIEMVLYAVVFVVLMAGYGWYGDQFLPAYPLEFFGVVLLFVSIGFGLGLISAVAGHQIPALRTIIRLTSMPLYLLSGVIIPISNLPRVVQEYLLWNPLLHLVELSRWAYFTSYHPLWQVNFEFPTAVAFVLLGIGVMMYRLRRLELQTRSV